MNRRTASNGFDPDLPEGYRLWETGDGEGTIPKPRLGEAAYHGPVGDLLRLAKPETEAHQAAIGMILLTKIGTMIGRRATVHIGEIDHHANLFTLIVGETSTGAKGSADGVVDRFMEAVDTFFCERHVVSGFGSGESLIDTFRDVSDTERGKGVLPREKRRVIDEPEFSRVLRVAHKEGSILGQVVRQGFDYRPIQHRTKTHGAIIATGHHLSVVGSITPRELVACISDLDIDNGLLNRFLFIHSEMGRLLPFGGYIDHEERLRIAKRVRAALDWLDPPADDGGGGQGPVHYFISDDDSPLARLWQPWYRQVRPGHPDDEIGLAKRHHAIAVRIANIYALLDRTGDLGTEHLEAGMAWTQYSLDSTRYLFGEGVTGHSTKLLAAIRDTGSRGLSGTDQQGVFSNNLTREQVRELRDDLEQRHLIVTGKVSTPGAPRIVSHAIWPK
jgi:hypothetical protein